MLQSQIKWLLELESIIGVHLCESVVLQVWMVNIEKYKTQAVEPQQ